MADSPFVGPTYPLRSKSTSVARTINMIPVRQDPQNDRSSWVFMDVPGLVDVDQVVPPTYYTSWPYPYMVSESWNADRARPQYGQCWVQPLEQFNADRAIPQSGTLAATLQVYNNHIREAFNADRPTPQSGTLDVVLHVYNDDLPNMFNADRPFPLSGTLVVVLIVYNDALPESFNADRPFPLSGTLA